MSEHTSPSALNDWFLSLPKGRQDILKDDKWMLAEAAFRYGIEVGRKSTEYMYIAKRHSDGSPWQDKFFCLDKGVYAHCDSAEEALRAYSMTDIKTALYDLLCTGVNPRLHGQPLGLYTILKGRNGVFDEVVEEGFIPTFAFSDTFEEPACRMFDRIVEALPSSGRFLADPHYDISQSLSYYWGLLCCVSRILKFQLPVEDFKASFSEQEYVSARSALQDINRHYWRDEDLREHSQGYFENVAQMVQQTARRCGLTLARFGYAEA